MAKHFLTPEFGLRVRRVREELGLSQEKLGERADMDRTYIGHVERNEVNPTLSNVLRIATALNIDPGELVQGLPG